MLVCFFVSARKGLHSFTPVTFEVTVQASYEDFFVILVRGVGAEFEQVSKELRLVYGQHLELRVAPLTCLQYPKEVTLNVRDSLGHS